MEGFDEHLDIELTASSASVNREADRQNSILLSNILAQYYQRTLELISIASNPQTPDEVRKVAIKISTAAGEVIDRTIRRFDQVRDPATFVVDMDEELARLNQQGGLPQEAMQQLFGMLAQGAGQQQPLELTAGERV